ncbi:MAG: T9SS type A sorting domain-containing protein [Chitinophagales bacterium]|jgi:hypothetical protein|nr:T9SS type A sorting domain-containing protein [Chitinophagales bacterium]
MKQKHNRLLWWSSKVLFAFLVGSVPSIAQVNFIHNGSFEILSDSILSSDVGPTKSCGWNGLPCTYGMSELMSIKHSYKDKRHVVPCSKVFHYCKIPRTGQTYLNVYLYYHDTWNGDVYGSMYAKLSDSLIRFHNYCLTFYLSLVPLSTCALNNIDAYFSTDTINCSPGTYVVLKPVQLHFTSNQLHFIDSNNWVKCQLTYSALGGERFLHIGEFSPLNVLDTLNNVGWGKTYWPSEDASFYSFDDISLIESNTHLQLTEDTLIYKGDSVLVGRSAQGLPIEWYDLQGQLICNSSSFWASPTKDTRFIARMDLCGEVSEDTVSVFVEAKPDGLPSQLMNSSIRLYPNPAKDNLYVQIPQQVSVSIELFDIYGRQVASKKSDINVGTTLQILDIKSLSAGTYFVRVKGMEKSEHREEAVFYARTFVKE